MEIAIIFKCLSDENRLKIIQLLSKRKYCVRALSQQLCISESAVSQHIRVLKNAGLLEIGDKNGYNIHYAVNKEVLLLLSEKIKLLADSVQENRVCGGNCKGETK
ncbi:MAG: winged helix-turn-helix transcriptional regulator [Oscillospiraceae bacterium]|nr:winged helix-turn-helix transcriptional regulator [Oscillospiraceae bacterium]